MDVDFHLSAGACARLSTAPESDVDAWAMTPTFQCLSIKKLDKKKMESAPDRYRLIISDGVHYVQAMLATQLNTLVEGGALCKHCIVVFEKYTSNVVQNKRLIIILGLRVLGEATEKIGDPKSLDATVAPQPATVHRDASNVAVAPSVQQAPPPARPIQATGGGRPAQPTVARTSGAPIFPIEALSPYQNNWTIKARVTQKSDIKYYSNAKGEGKLFSLTLMDETGEIKATGFNQTVDEFFHRLEEGKVYFISRARVNLARKKFSHLQNEYELGLERNTHIEECYDQTNVPEIKYSFVALKDLDTVQKDSVCDVIGVVKEVGALGEITSKTTQKTIIKRELILVDRSGFSVRLTLWGEQAKKYTAEDQPVIAVKGAKVGDFGGRSLSMLSSSTMSINPDTADAHALRGWFDASGTSSNFQSHSNIVGGGSGQSAGINRSELLTTQEVKDNNLGQDKPDYFSTRVTITHIKSDNLSYPACPSEGCNKKVTEIAEAWRCEKCERSYEKPEHRYLVTFCAADHTGQLWLQGFNEVGVAIFGMSANELKNLEEQDKDSYENVVKKVVSSQYNVACRAKQDTFNDTTRIRYGINRIAPLDFAEDTQHVLDKLQSYL